VSLYRFVFANSNVSLIVHAEAAAALSVYSSAGIMLIITALGKHITETQ
jgi:hypothetical protein